MKIQWIVNNINQVGGIERVVAQLSNFFVNHGCEVEIVSLCTKETKCFFDLDPNVVVRNLNTDEKSNSRIGIIGTIHGIAKESNADIVLGCHEYICNAMVINKPFFKGSIIVTQHCSVEFFTKKRLLLESLILRFADCFVVLSEWSKQYYEKRKIKNCIVIPNAITQEAYTSRENREKTIVTAGRLTGVKRFDFLIRAFKLVHDIHPEWKLKILGDGEDRKKLTDLVEELNLEEAVSLPGFQKNVIEEFRRASVFTVSSQSEGFSMVLLEAMSQSLPVVCVDIPVLREILDNGKYGILSKCDENEFASAINDLLSDEEKLSEFGERALERSREYSMEKVGMEWLALFQSLCKKKGRANIEVGSHR